MPTFEELLHVNLSTLQSAADDWAAMAVLLKKVAKEAGSMRSLAQGTEWRGENASVTKPFVVRVSDEFTDAVTEAESIGNLLASAHDKIKTARNDLKELCGNPPAGITIHTDGTLSRSVQPRMSHGDPEYVVIQADFDALQRRIDAIIARTAEADSTCSWGLRQLTKDKHEFGSTYYGSLKDASIDARQAQQTKTDSVEYTPPAKWGSGTIKPIAEFLSYRSWMGGGEAFLHGDINGAIQGLIGGAPSARRQGQRGPRQGLDPEQRKRKTPSPHVHQHDRQVRREDIQRAGRCGRDGDRLLLHAQPAQDPGRHPCGRPSRTGKGEIPMTHSAGPPTRGRRRPDLRHWLKPQGSRFLVLGMSMSVGGLAGGVRSALDGKGIWTILGTFAVGIFGLLIVVSFFVNYEDRRGRR
ncbi:hypothetical protein ABZV80_23195 [Streptomyces sp. NPDC005132]|uniref:hypothetical protein n=2 Tax=Streptomyces TaxID=1883 RepID=UPI0033AF98B7